MSEPFQLKQILTNKILGWQMFRPAMGLHYNELKGYIIKQMQ